MAAETGEPGRTAEIGHGEGRLVLFGAAAHGGYTPRFDPRADTQRQENFMKRTTVVLAVMIGGMAIAGESGADDSR